MRRIRYLEPLDVEEQRLVPMLRGEVEPTQPSAMAWIRFLANGRKERLR